MALRPRGEDRATQKAGSQADERRSAGIEPAVGPWIPELLQPLQPSRHPQNADTLNAHILPRPKLIATRIYASWPLLVDSLPIIFAFPVSVGGCHFFASSLESVDVAFSRPPSPPTGLVETGPRFGAG